MRKRLLHILFWSVLAAAFIGPGTITTAASAGAGFGFTLLWALLFSTIACIVLQEASARLTLASGSNLGQAIRNRFKGSFTGKAFSYLVLVSILLGCAAYEAGNILGAISGLALVWNLSTISLTLIIGTAAFLLMWFSSTKVIAQILGGIVAIMGLCFLTTAFIIQPAVGDLFSGAFIPHIPTGSELLVIGLIGTTVVPYNLFLGSGLKHTQSLKEMRLSLSTAVLLGGIISMGVLVVGTSIQGDFTYQGLSLALSDAMGAWASVFFGAGLAAAGISSALTAPLAAALTAQSMLGDSTRPGWQEKGAYTRTVWGAVLVTGVFFGLIQVQPIPAIILAQALNGIILPLVAIFLIMMVNDTTLLKPSTINSTAYNLLMGIIIFITMIIGFTNVAKALARLFGLDLVDKNTILGISVLLSAVAAVPIILFIRKHRSGLS